MLLSYYHGVKTCYISKTKLLDFPEAAGEWGGGHTEKEVEPGVPDQRGTTTLPSPSAPVLKQK